MKKHSSFNMSFHSVPEKTCIHCRITSYKIGLTCQLLLWYVMPEYVAKYPTLLLYVVGSFSFKNSELDIFDQPVCVTL